VTLDPRVPNKTLHIRKDLPSEEEAEVLFFLDKNSDVFTWPTYDMIGLSRKIVEHRLYVNPSTMPKKQKLCKMLEEKAAAAKAEVQRLLNASFIREVDFLTWLANVVMVSCFMAIDLYGGAHGSGNQRKHKGIRGFEIGSGLPEDNNYMSYDLVYYDLLVSVLP
jgi:hypothetical protein